MDKHRRVQLIMAITGTLVVSLAWLAPLAFTVESFLTSGEPRLDYLLPAEVFPIVLLGEGLLLWASLRAKRLVRQISWIGGLSLLGLVGSQVIAVISGMASGRISPEGWPLILTTALLIGYDLMVLAASVAGMRLIAILSRERDS